MFFLPIVPVIIAGGLGSRLWPLSSKQNPKPFIKIFGNHSLFQKTLLRVSPFLNHRLPLMVTNEAFHPLCEKQAKEVGIDAFYSLVEPCMKNTAPAIISAAHFLFEKENDPLMLVLPADHVIAPFDRFVQCINDAKEFAIQGALVTFGIEPSEPKMCYGYIKKGACAGHNGFVIDAFKEKPDRTVAQHYVDSKEYLWNSGIFMAKASVFLSEMAKSAPSDLNLITDAVDNGVVQGTHTFLNEKYYSKLNSESIDYCIMEKTEHGVVVPTNIEWSDIGTWSAYWSHHDKDDKDNVLEGTVHACDSKGCLFVSKDIEIVGFGLEDVVAISAGNKVMITTREKAPELKKLIQAQEKQEILK